jgi:methylated-DNA-protein-cysteine methyltransferase-like protein
MASSRRGAQRRKTTPKVARRTAKTPNLERLFKQIWAVVRRIPRGKVATYGQIAELAGLPGGGRVAGAAMKGAKGVPWQRVMGKRGPRRGGIAIHDPVGAAVQQRLLEAEGVVVDERGLVDLVRFGWMPT